MRIISGIYGRRRFTVPSTFKARPTTDLAKESLFNILNNIIDLDGADALDLFSGTGSIAFELLSRGCSTVTAVENDRFHASFIAKIAKELNTDKLNLICGDAFRLLAKPDGRQFDFIFADPPYTLGNLQDVPNLVLSSGLLRSEGVFVMEHSAKYNFSTLAGFRKQKEYGAVNFSFFF